MRGLRYVLMASVASLLFVAGAQTSSAADLPLKAAPAPVAVSNWTGLYIGINAGAGRAEWSRDGFYDTNPVSDRFNSAAVTVGGQAGYNWQVGPSFLLGVEGDWNWLAAENRITCAAGPTASGGSCYDSSSLGNLKSTWLATIRGRLGWIVAPSFLVYGTGGVAFGDTEYAVNDYTGGGTGSLRQTHTGWAAGFGGEYMVARNWTVKAEYLHVDLGKKDYVIAGTIQPDFFASIRPTYDLVRLGVNYKPF